ncbi:MAG: methylated-DNA--[protein]-cysteine S-methyltransferase [gamma proteobacterium symbiont of Bathyaustriella thionipta]|nr:methylated-DNA--[protein]-cysteine S-methyltransferase [gamma proteobacterium symbiont of Bathyaustriella thionipta]MCU7950326.1 methylated-DNA--[protein]-cysteine S-methyltransferase [gamma proteobacterium symbiont of Bathyaustriella thionipta]MCU7952012.1 methylated-DNA--[protein]-cysteine S-methyltransferase [gamma proteobacterium symbiont of Bathyaustriella thionipta]MCU7956864.1 methylated-DNA--[protein]-cysteine S-methyltransferase [gamma proteobacterium symbiont of Bathyaustriella thio
MITGTQYFQFQSDNQHVQASTLPVNAPSDAADLAFAKIIKYELDSYFNKTVNLKDRCFSINYDRLSGTEFQQKVWTTLLEIPVGEVRTYGGIAKELNSSARAVGNACRQNLFPVIVPCHRVVSASGIGGYAGDTLDRQHGQINFLNIKQWLLAHEKTSIK